MSSMQMLMYAIAATKNDVFNKVEYIFLTFSPACGRAWIDQQVIVIKSDNIRVAKGWESRLGADDELGVKMMATKMKQKRISSSKWP
jgi:hypothetical protein